MSESEQRYLSYLLRLWQTQGEGEPVWQASLESARTGKREGFDSLEALFGYLRELASGRGSIPGDRGGPNNG